VTLRFFGELTPPEVARACDALQQVASCLPTNLVARGGPATRFLGPGLVVWPVEGLAAPAGAVEQATALLGQPPASRRFLGHLTIARGARGTDLRVERQLLAPLTGSWAVTSLSLVASELNVGGARYTEAAAFRVGPASLG
jgi:2'-5' RNA ligase